MPPLGVVRCGADRRRPELMMKLDSACRDPSGQAPRPKAGAQRLSNSG